MHIGNYFENYTKSGTGMSAYDALASGSVSTHTVGVKGMSQGNVFEGNVSKIKGNQVVLVLENGQSIKARLDGSIKLSLGQSMFFQVKSNENGVISIKPYTDGIHSNPTLLKALLAAGLMADEKNLDMVNAMIKEKMPIDVDSLLSMHKNVLNAPNVDSDAIVKLVKLNVPVTEENAKTLSLYLNGNHEIIDQTKSVLAGIYDLFSEASNDSKLLAGINASVITELFGEEVIDTPYYESSLEEENALLTNQNNSNVDEQINNDNSDFLVKTVINGEEITIESNPIENLKTELIEGVVTTSSINFNSEESAELKEELVKQEFEVIITSEKSVEKLKTTLGSLFNEKQLDSFSEILRNIGMLSESEVLFDDNGNINKALSPKQMLEMISIDLLHNAEKTDTSDIKRLFASSSYRMLLESVVESEWSVLPEKTNAKNLNELYNKISKQILGLENIAKESGIESKVFSDSTSAVRNNLSFLNELNQAFSYIQIPLSLGNKSANGELFVYTNKKSIKDNDGVLSAALHLDMEHLGMTDVFVKMNEKKLDTNFSIADDLSYKLIERYLPVLKEKLDKLGFNTTLKIQKSETTRPGFMNELFMQEGFVSDRTDTVQRYSFDVRT